MKHTYFQLLSALSIVGPVLLGAQTSPILEYLVDKPTSDVLAQTVSDADVLLAFDALEDIPPAERYAWGQSFTVPSGQSWEIDSISLERSGESVADVDAKLKLVIFNFDALTFDNESWGLYTDPLAGSALAERGTYEFDLPDPEAGASWMRMQLGSTVLLEPGAYGFAIWTSNPSAQGTTGGALTLMHGGSYSEGQLLRIRGDTGNTLPGGALNFAMEGSVEAFGEPHELGAASGQISLANGIYDIEVASSDFFNDSDNGVFAGQIERAGDFHLETRARSLDGGIYPWAKAGLMARVSTDPEARSAGVYFTSARGATFQSRFHRSGLTTRSVEGSLGGNGYLRLIRVGDALHGAASTDGATWVALGKRELANMPTTLITGIGVAGQNESPTTARVDAVSSYDVPTETGLFGFTLIDGSDGSELRSFFQGDVLDLNHYEAGLQILAESAGSAVGSVVFEVNGVELHADAAAPFTVDLSDLPNGTHTLEAIPWAGVNGQSQRLDTLKVDFEINRGSGPMPPNIVYIFTDDQGYADTGFNGSQDVFTPNLDRLAESGLRVTAGYATAPQCGPSRAGMVSGMYQGRFGYNDNNSVAGLPLMAVAPTGPELLKELGYTNAMIGKWHIGDEVDKLAEIIAGGHDNVMPWKRGFDYTYAMDGGSCHYFPYRSDGRSWLTSLNFEYRNLEVMEGSQTVNYLDLPENTYQTTEFTERAIQFIDRNKNDPFFVYLAYNAPHTPVSPRPDEREANAHIPDGTRRNLAGAMTGIDREVGRLIDYLDSAGLRENTLIFFLSDNGGPTSRNASFNDPFNGFKGDILEGGTRVPFLISWKGQIPSNRDFEGRVFSFDYLPTILQQQGRSIPDYLDGLPLLPALQGKENPVDLADKPRIVHWRGNVRSVHWGPYKKIDQRSSAGRRPYLGHVNIETNIKENLDTDSLSALTKDRLDAFLSDYLATISESGYKDSWFDGADSDNDGILDTVERDLAGDLETLSSIGDADKDGTTDADEIRLGTDPLDASSRFELKVEMNSTLPEELLIKVPTVGLRAYQLWSSADLAPASWSKKGEVFYGNGDGSEIGIQLSTEITSRRFYRVALLP